MTQDPDFVLANSLDAIDSARRRASLTFAAMWTATFAALVWFSYVLRTSDSPKRALSAAVVALVFAILLGAASVMLYVARMTRRILRAIELAMVTSAPPDA